MHPGQWIGNNVTSTTADPMPTSGLPRLDAGLQQLSATIGELERRLVLVLRPDPPHSVDPAEKDGPVSEFTRMLTTLENLTMRLNGIVCALDV